MNAQALPRLLYVGDVPVEASYHGSALLYRLLQGYPADRLRVLEGEDARSQPERRLPGVSYGAVRSARARWMNTRLHAGYALCVSFRAARWAGRIERALDGFVPQAVLTVAHGHLWIAAARFAGARGLPLHLVVHDDWPRVAALPAPFTGRVDRQFGEAYRAARSRLCVSPYMAEAFARRYGVPGEFLPPSRARDAGPAPHPARHDALAAPHATGCDAAPGLVCAFAGTLNSPDYARRLVRLAEALDKLGGRLLVYGPITTEQGRAAGLDRANVSLRGWIDSAALLERLRAEADVLFVPMSFAPAERPNMQSGFPSKLADYTAAGVAMLVWGPEDCSAVRWARENAGVAEGVDRDDDAALGAALDRLRDPAHRRRLAAVALAVGERQFSHGAVQARFHAALARPEAAR